jgi:hypothetical protein
MSVNKDTLVQCNVEQAIQRTFNIKKPNILPGKSVIGSGVEISGFAVASQEARELNDIMRSEGHHDGFYDFAPNCKWSVLNMNKIKVQWAARCSQVLIQNQIWNIVAGSWEEAVFIPDVLFDRIRVEIRPIGKDILQSTVNYVLIPHATYHIQSDISNMIPQIRFGKKQLECVQPKSIATVSVNRQGLYVNRKYREKTRLVALPPDHTYPLIPSYQLDIYYDDQLLDNYEFKALKL